jgi:hypothetical protein
MRRTAVADDIVTRLRSTSLFPEWSDLAPDYGIGDDGEKLSVFVYGEQLLNEAANEIERLRIAGDLLAAALRVETINGQMAVCDGTSEAFQAWQEARRG